MRPTDSIDQHEHLASLLAELEQKYGPIDPRILEEVRQDWPTPQERLAKRRDD